MDPLQAAASLIQGAQALLQGVSALARATRDLQDAPEKVTQLEETLGDLGKLHRTVTRTHSTKLHHPELNAKLSSFESLITGLEVQVSRARKLVTRRRGGMKVRKVFTVVVTAVTGDELTDIVKSMNNQLVEWIRKNSINESISKAFENAAEKLTSYLRVQPQAGYHPLSKASRVRALLESSSSAKVLLIHGLSGMGKSCLARHVAADPPGRFSHGAVHIVFGQCCTRTASQSNRQEYHTRLAAKFSHLLRLLGRKKAEVDGLSIQESCELLQETLTGKSILVVLDDVWESDIIERFTELYDNECVYLATTRNQSVYETIEAEKVEIGQEDVEEHSITILMQHSQLTQDELPQEAAELLVQRCGHHPLTLAVIGKALRKETRVEQWERAIDDLSTYAAQAPVPVHYLNEKEVESAATVFGSFEFSLNSMSPHAKELFISLAALSWSNGPVPEPCLEAIQYSLEQDTIFRLVIGQLCEGSLLQRVSEMFYRVHDMVGLYLQTRVDEALSLVFKHTKEESRAALVPWLYNFGNRKAQKLAEGALVEVFWSNNEDLPATVLWNIVDVLSTCSTMSELEASSVNFSKLIGPELARLFLLQSDDLHAAVARCIANCFTSQDYERHTFTLVQAGAPEKLACLLRNYNDTYVQRDAAQVLAKLSEFRQDSSEEILREVPLKELLDLLDPGMEENHDPVIDSLMTLAKAGEEHAVREMFSAGVGTKLEQMLVAGSESAQELAIVALKSFNELGGSKIVQSFLRSGILQRLPWQMRLRLERLSLLERKPSFKQRAPVKRYQLLQQIVLLKEASEKEQLQAMQELAGAVDKVGNDPQVLEVILTTNLVEVLAMKVDVLSKFCGSNRIKSEACLALAKLSSAGARLTKMMLKMKVLENLVGIMMLATSPCTDAAYSAFHSFISTGQRMVVEQVLRASLIEKIMILVESGMEIGLHCLQDLVEFGGKECIERLLSLRVVEKLASLESKSKQQQTSRGGEGLVMEFARLVRKSSGLSAQEHRVLNQQVLRQARGVVKDPKQIAKLTSLLRLNNSDRSDSSGSSKRRTSFGSSSASSSSSSRTYSL